MACIHPLFMYCVANDYSGEVSQPIIFKGYRRAFDDFVSNNPRVVRHFVIGCGHCQDCRLAYSRQWADRLILESKLYPENTNWFVTLTYNDNFVPLDYIMDRETGVTGNLGVLKMEHLSKFMKALRQIVGDGIRFFGAGEYGELSRRPHFHVILLNCPLDAYRPKVTDPEYVDLPRNVYISDIIKRCWKYGYSSVALASYETMAYTARYCIKKLKGDDRIHYEQELNLLQQEDPSLNEQPPESVRMSRRPGIGVPCLDPAVVERILRTDSIAVADSHGSHSIRPPRTFENNLVRREAPGPLKSDLQECIDRNHARRVASAEAARQLRLQGTTLLDEELNAIHARETQSKMKSRAI